MRALLDTHALIWMACEPDRLGSLAHKVILNTQTRLYVSMASFWELAIKLSLGKLELQDVTLDDLRAYAFQNSIQMLPISYLDCKHVIDLPFYHRDPFDRLLISQAMLGGLKIISKDMHFDKYDVQTVWS